MPSQIKIMVVDDEPSIRDSLTRFLDDFDFKVSSAESAEDALARLARTPHDVAIIDIRLPQMDGDALILKAHALQPSLRFLIHTGSVEYKLPAELETIGMRPEDIFPKPLNDLTVFVDAIQRLLSQEK